jgi:hypothetical protein
LEFDQARAVRLQDRVVLVERGTVLDIPPGGDKPPFWLCYILCEILPELVFYTELM